MILHPSSPSKGDALFKLENYGVYITVLYSRRIRTFISPASGSVFPFDTIEYFPVMLSRFKDTSQEVESTPCLLFPSLSTGRGNTPP